MNLALSNSDLKRGNPLDDLCDDLMCHIFECHSCINGKEDDCPTFRDLNLQIAAKGGPAKGIALTM